MMGKKEGLSGNILLKNAYSSQPCGFELSETHVELILRY